MFEGFQEISKLAPTIKNNWKENNASFLSAVSAVCSHPIKGDAADFFDAFQRKHPQRKHASCIYDTNIRYWILFVTYYRLTILLSSRYIKSLRVLSIEKIKSSRVFLYFREMSSAVIEMLAVFVVVAMCGQGLFFFNSAHREIYSESC